MILKNLWRRKTRTLLTLLGIAVGVAAVVAMSAFGEGFANGFENIMTSSEADLTVGQKDAMMLLLSSVDEAVGNEIAGLPGVTKVAGTVIGFVQMPETPYFVVMGEDPRGFGMQHYPLIAGQALAGRKQILIGKITSENFNKRVGESFRLNGVTYRVVGIYETGVNLEDGGAVMRLDDAQSAFDRRHQVNYFQIQVKDAASIDTLKHQIEERWPSLAATRSGEATRQDDMIGLYRSFGWFLGVFAILVGGLGMMNTTMMSVLERTREIGVLRAVGWRARRVVGMIMGESLALAIAGGIVGIGLGIGLTNLAQLVPAVQSLLGNTFSPSIFVQAMGTAVLLGAVGGLVPAWRAAQLAPGEAMRHESSVGGNAGWPITLLSRMFGNGSLRNLWRRPTRTLVTVTGLAIGVGFIVALLAMVDGFTADFMQMASAGQADLMAEQSNASDLSLSLIDERVANQIATRPEVKSVSKLIMGVSTAPGLPYMLVFGVDPGETYLQHYRLREGRLISRPNEAMLGQFAANGLKKQVGDSLRVAGTSYRIVGLYENGTAYEDAGVVISLRDAQAQFNKRRKFSIMAISLVDAQRGRAEEIARALERQYPQIIVSKSSVFTERMQDFASTTALLNTLVVLALVVGGIVMMNSMLMSVFERTQEIGVLRAMGWRRWRVVGMVLGEALAISLLSAGLGLLIGMGVNYLLTLVPGYGVFMMPRYSWATYAQAIGLAVGLGALGGFYPAWRAANLRPMEALRYE